MPPKSNLQFIWADDFLNMLLVYRAVWIQGRYGGGKTSLAVILAAWLLNQGHVNRVISNTQSVLDTPIQSPSEFLYDAALLIDETHAFISDRSSVSQYAKFLRKTNYYLLMPSVMPPHIRLTSFSVQRIFNGMIYALPLWVYRWNLRSGNIREKGTFAILNPQSVWGGYNTKSVPIDDAGISDQIDYTIKYEQWKSKCKIVVDEPHLETQKLYLSHLRAEEGRKAGSAARKSTQENMSHAPIAPTTTTPAENPFADLQDVLEDAAEENARAAEVIEEAAKGLRKKIHRT